MYGPVSDTFLQFLTQSKEMTAVADLYYDGEILLSNLKLSSWRLTVDRNADSHRTATMVLAEPTLVPSAVDTLDPYGIEIRLRVGFVYPGGTNELIPAGVFPIETVNWKDALSGALPSLQLYDRQKTVERSKALYSSSRGGWLAQQLMRDLILDAMQANVKPTIVFTVDPDLPNPRLPGGTMWDNERWGLVKVCAEAIGADVYFDSSGQPTITTIPKITSDMRGSDAVWQVSSGQNLMDASRSVSRTGVYNAVAVYGVVPSDSQPQPVGFAYDLDPNSATYYNGPFGGSSLKTTNPLLTTSAQCQDAANSLLNSVTGLARSMTFNCLPNPALETGDLILVTFADGSKELHLIDSYQFSSAGDFSATTRTIQYQPFVGI